MSQQDYICLREMHALTTGKSKFAVRQNVCRALYFGRTAKNLVVVHFFSARQTCNVFFLYRAPYKKRTAKVMFAVCFFLAHGKVFPPPSPPRINEVSLFKKNFDVHFYSNARVLFLGARQTHRALFLPRTAKYFPLLPHHE
jgi:hypothetical protein